VTDPAFIRWWRTQMVPPSPTPAQLRAWARRAWEAATERAAGLRFLIDIPDPEWSGLKSQDAAVEAYRAAIRAGAHFRATLPPTRGGSPRESRPAGNPGNPGV
jgi:hypothetical protein